MSFLSSRHFRIVLWIFAVLTIPYVLYNWFFPVAHYFFDDEWFVLSERVWHKDAGAWLKHLLFFNQTRHTWVGDFMLYRPGLFAWMWLEDVLFRGERVGQQVLLVILAVAVYAPIFQMLRRPCGSLLALAATVFAFATLRGANALAWPHIGGYLIAMGLYMTGAYFLLTSPFTRARLALTAAAFFLAAICHEFVSLTLVVLIGLQLLWWRRGEDKESSRRRLLALAIPLVLYGILVLTAYSILRPPGFFSPGEVERVQFSVEHLLRVLTLNLNFLLYVLDTLIPYIALDPGLFGMRMVVAGVLFFGLFLAYRGVPNKDLKSVCVAIAPAPVMMAGLLFGRVATRGVVKEHYFPMFQYFAVVAVMLVVAQILKNKPQEKAARGVAILVLVFLTASVRAAWIVGQQNAANRGMAELTHRTVKEIISRIQSGEPKCYAGLLGFTDHPDLNRAANIALQEYTCGWREGKPVYFRLNADLEAREFEPPAKGPQWSAKDALSTMNSESQSEELVGFLKNQPANIRQAEQNATITGLINYRPLPSRIEAREIAAGFESKDAVPEFYNAGILIVKPTETFYFVVLNNQLHVLNRSQNELKELASSQVSGTMRDFTLRIAQWEGGCLVFFNDLLLTQIRSCLIGESLIATLRFDNGTPDERLVRLNYQPLR